MEDRNLGLDLFRGICGYGVAICHFEYFLYKNTNFEYFSYLFVEFFFVLSGFVLHNQLLKTIGNKNNVIIFFKRRWFRTIPLYLIFLTITSLLFNKFLTLDYFKYFLFVQKIAPNFVELDFYPIAWSLSIEESFYLITPFLLIFFKKNYIKMFLFIILIILMIKIFSADRVDSNFFRTGTFLRFDAIIFGFLLRHFYNYFKNLKLIIISNSILCFTFIYFKDYFLSNSEMFLAKIIFIFLMQIISALTLTLFFELRRVNFSIIIKKFSSLISFQTYSIYLMHFIVLYLLQSFNLERLQLMVVYISTLFIFSTLTYIYIEKPILKLRPKYD